MVKLIVYNVLKHRFLFLLIGLVVALFSFYVLIGMNLVFSISESLTGAVSDNLSGDLVIASSEAASMDLITMAGEKDIRPLPDLQALLAFLDAEASVAVAAPRLRIRALARSENSVSGCILVGVDPERDAKLLPSRSPYEGGWISGQGEIAMYYRHSDRLTIRPGDYVDFMAKTIEGYSASESAVLTGTLTYGELAYYLELAPYGFVSLDFLNAMIGAEEPTAGEVLVRFRDGIDVSRAGTDLGKAITERFGSMYRFIRPQDVSGIIRDIHMLSYFLVYAVAVLLLFIVYLCSSFLVSASIETRRRELGVYQAVGVGRGRIALLMSGEFLFVMSVFGILGIAAGLIVMRSMTTGGIEATIIPLRMIFGRNLLHVTLNSDSFLVVLVLLFVSFLGNTLHAVLKLSRLNPVEVMREL